MAPALTEPLSPNEKLSNSTATPTPSTRANNNRKVEVSSTTTLEYTSANINNTTTTTTTSSSNNNILRRNRNSIHPTTSTRVTRSKDKDKDGEQVVEKAIVALSSVAANAIAETANQKIKCNHNNNERMGLSTVVLNNNNNNNKNNNNTIQKSSNEASAVYGTDVKDTSTEQLLADLTDNFEEAITAEICLRKKLQDVELNKAAEDSSIASKDHTATEATKTATKLGTPHMETNDALKAAGNSVHDSNVRMRSGTENAVTAAQVVPLDMDDVQTDLSASEVTPKARSAAQNDSLSGLTRVNTDSTATASEIEDNLEERLSQLDGTATVSECSQNLHELSSTAATPAVPATMCNNSALVSTSTHIASQQTPPAVPIQQQQQGAGPTQSTTSSAYLKDSATTGSSGVDIEDQEEIEEMLKVLKGFDGTGAPDGLCDLNALFSEVYTTLNYEEMNNSAQPATTVATKSTSPFKDSYAEIEKKQLSLHRKIDFMLRRIRKLQSRYLCKHASEEVAGLFELSARLAIDNKSGAGVPDAAAPTSCYNADTSTAAPPIISGRPPANTWQELRKTPVSSTQVGNMLRKLETAAVAQQLNTKPTNSNAGNNTHFYFKKTKKTVAQEAAAAAAAAAAMTAKDQSTVVVPTFDTNISEELNYVAGLLQTEMREVQTALDSDATESSSGADSADEIIIYNNPIQQSLSIAKRAAWRYSRDRAAIASRWSWLLSQIADLEIKIRQHTDLMQEIVRTKGAVVCATDPMVAKKQPPNALEIVPSSVNGYMGVGGVIGGGSSSTTTADSNDDDASTGCCRTRGYVAAHFRKRKLLQTNNIHTISKKAARPSTIKCGCQWPLCPCALCTGRADPMAPRDLPDTMMMSDRIALLDPGFHPVLSFPEDISNSLHFEAIARLPDWQQRVMRCQVKSIAKSIWKAEREAAAAAGHAATTKRRYVKKKDRIAEEKQATTTASASASASAGATTATTVTDSEATAASCTTTTGPTAGSSGGSGSGSIANVIGMEGNDGSGTVAAAAVTGVGCGGNGIGTLSTSTTPLVANMMTKNAKKPPHCHQMGDVMPEPQSSIRETHLNHNHLYVHQTGDYPPPPPPVSQNYDPYNPSQAHSSLISSGKNNKQRRYGTNAYYNHHHQPHNNNNFHQHHYNNNTYYHNSNGGDMSILCPSDNWDNSTRSRTSSPTFISNYKYERSLDRKNRSSYDIDNIVIPYSVAAATRVEILPYKEIPTPKWRVIDEEALANAIEMDLIEAKSETDANPDVKVKIDFDAVKVANTSSVMPINGIKEADEKSRVKKEIKADVEIVAAPSSLEIKKGLIAEKLCDNTKSLKSSLSEENVAAIKVSEENANTAKVTVTESNISKTNSDSADEEPAVKKVKIETIPNNVVKVKDVEKPKANTYELTDDVEELHNEDEVGVEDISDETMMLRHERALTEERRKFQTYLKFPWSTRSRANRRIDSRAESSGANTPDPSSPAPQTPGGDQESIPSPLAPSTPLNPLESITETCDGLAFNAASTSSGKLNNIHGSSSSKRYERRRTTSAKKERELERRSSTPDPREFIPPYEPLQFPLSDELFESLLSTMPLEFQEIALNEDYANAADFRPTRIRNNVRGSDFTNVRRSSKTMSVTFAPSCARKAKKRSNKGVRLKGNPARGLHTHENGKVPNLEELDGTVLASTEDDDDDGPAPEFIADDDDDDYPKHHLAPNDDDEEELLRGANSGGNNTALHDTFETQLDDYEAYVGGGRNMLGDSDADSSATEPFQDDDPNDPEWKGESEDRSERVRKKF